jgi:hypothetical protein
VYQCVVGLAEVGPAVLLLFPRTATLGALAYLPVIVNVVLVDLCFGIAAGPTVMALTLLLCDLLLLAADRHRLRSALAALADNAGGSAAPAPSWGRIALWRGSGLGLAILITFIATLIEGAVQRR